MTARIALIRAVSLFNASAPWLAVEVMLRQTIRSAPLMRHR
jgi:hypothetical protein